ncbi:hypothetical protein LEMA_uP020480.1 [Plenodomus lingam JN3]|uniref:Uncharacterized protein n=1 Tax=Leptosphaeria maculans (strain JN3 / isolate v23.1.3 / race Av1-4-5-6-7-8) TaxID=985895 RepID=E5AB77_LEPMJ|nr:hypothetical protein LEMA_uP020480.1 [Plenodomus lingam JN3]CBY00918.1 hypothetical protein LEMA_uP020480.1 [Plenodomus lingam JN3]
MARNPPFDTAKLSHRTPCKVTSRHTQRHHGTGTAANAKRTRDALNSVPHK